MRRWAHAGIPVKYRDLRIDVWRPYNEASNAALTAARRFIKTWPQRWCRSDGAEINRSLAGRGLALIGAPGSGKTTLACLVAQEIALTHNVSIMFCAFADLIAALVEQISLAPQADRGEQRAVDRYWAVDKLKRRIVNAPLVIFDDVGKEHRTASGYAESELDRILRRRFRLGLPTVTTSNIPLEEWGSIYHPSMASFACEAFDEVIFGGRDLRR